LAKIFARLRDFKGGIMARGPLAGASGPGKYSKRTDLPSAYYGEGVETSALKSQMPVSKTTGVADDVGGRPRDPLTPITPLFALSERPQEPITNGIDIGAGAGSETLMLNQMSQQQSLSQTLAEMLPYDTNGEIAALYEQALSRGL
jgi:hypothetical protein